MRDPKGILLDFDGVIVTTTVNPEWSTLTARHIEKEFNLVSLESGLSFQDFREDLLAASLAFCNWCNAMSRPAAPKELSHEQFWADFVAGDWPEPAAAFVRDNARDLCLVMGDVKHIRTPRMGIREVLIEASNAGIPVAIVSNTLRGEVNRRYLDMHDLADGISAQIYSDEVGVRKPNPDMISLGAAAIRVAVRDCWYVGDRYDRDVLCGRRAGVGGNILMRSGDTSERPENPKFHPDTEVADPSGLQALICGAVSRVDA